MNRTGWIQVPGGYGEATRAKRTLADENATTRIHKRLIDLNAPTEVVKQIIINIEAGVEVEVTIAA